MRHTIRTVAVCTLAALLLLSASGAGQTAHAQKKEPEKIGLPKTPDELDLIDVGQVTGVLRSDLIKLSTGKSYRLAHIRVPVFHEEAATAFLKKELMGQTVGVYLDKRISNPEKDRYDNLYAHILRDDNKWIQADMIARGLSWAYSTEHTRSLVIPLYRYETLAQKMKVGFWKDQSFASKTKANIMQQVNSYQLFMCLIVDVTLLAEKIFFNCQMDNSKGAFYGFSISHDKIGNFSTDMRSAPWYFRAWRGAPLIVRGWVEKDTTINPGNVTALVNVTHPEQLDFIDPKTGESTTKYE